MARRLTTSNLVADVRSLIDETNQASIDDERDILPALNRAQDVAANILAQSYESPLLTYTSQQTTGNVREYDIPHDAFEMRLEKLEVAFQNGVFNPITRVNYRDATALETNAVSAFPEYYSEVGDKYRLYPGSTGAYPLRVWYLKDPDPLVLEQGTVTRINSAGNYVTVDTIGSDLTVENDSFNSYVSFIDGRTGRNKGSCQIQVLTDNKITFKTVPVRTTVLGKTISGSLPDDLEVDDLICTAGGSCISVLKKPFANFLIDMATSELLNTKLGIPSELAEVSKKEMARIVKESWAGRETYLRIKTANPHWQVVGRKANNRY